MPVTHKNRLVTTISNTPGGAGALTISTAQSGYRTFAAGDDGKLFDVVIVDGTAWEVRTNCTYTNAGTSLSRGTLEDSSTGSAITLTSAAVVTETATAGRANNFEAMRLSGFSAYADGTNQQTLTTGAGTTLIHGGSGGALKTEEFDIEGWFTQSTGIFFPQEPGLWLIGGTAVLGNIADTFYTAIYISYSNDGSTWDDNNAKSGIAWRGAASANQNIGGSGSFIVDANGTTDRWALRIFHNTPTTPPVVPASASVRGWARFWARRIGVTS